MFICLLHCLKGSLEILHKFFLTTQCLLDSETGVCQADRGNVEGVENMLRKMSILALVLLLTFYPASVLAEESSNDNDNADTDTTEQQEESQTEEQGETEEEPDAENADVEGSSEEDTNKEDAAEGEEESSNEEGSDSSEDSVEPAANEPEEGEGAEGEEETPAENEGEENGSENENETADEDEELDLTKVYGTARGDIHYDFNKGYYVLRLQAGLSNHSSSKELIQKWIAFSLPNGVAVPNVDEIPSGIVPVQLYDGSNGIAVKIPDVGTFPNSKTVFLDVPLIGEPNDNNPNRNLYLMDVDVDNQTYSDLGQIEMQRKIDFDPMKGEPVLDLDASIEGDVAFDDEARHYVLDVTVDATNNTESAINELYAGIPVPEGVAVVDVSEGVQPLDNGEVAVKLPAMEAGKDGQVTYQIPLIGKTDAVVDESSISTYFVRDGSYSDVSSFNGSIKVDYSTMDKAWDFSATGQIVTDFPDLPKDQFGLRFAFTTQNLTIEEVDAVEVEFNVPDHINIHEPDEYTQGDIPDSLEDFLSGDSDGSGNLDIEWNGNTALINLDTVQGTQWNEGYFTAFGESSKSLSDLEGLNVTVKLLQDGDTVEELNVPFELVDYEGKPVTPEDPKDPEDPQDPQDPKPEEPGESPGKGDSSDDGDDSTDPSKDGDDSTDPSGNDDDSTDSSKGDDDSTDPSKDSGDTSDDGDVVIETSDDGSSTGKGSDEDSSDKLPATATNMFTLILIGSVLTVAGGVLMFVRRRFA